jgi:hypothetical protein
MGHFSSSQARRQSGQSSVADQILCDDGIQRVEFVLVVGLAVFPHDGFILFGRHDFSPLASNL